MSSDIRDLDAIDELLAALRGAKAWLREHIAQDINRKRTPDIDFRVVFLQQDEVR